MEDNQLSYSEYIKCLNACVKVIEVQKRKKQLPSDDAGEDEGFVEEEEPTERFFDEEVDEGVDVRFSLENERSDNTPGVPTSGGLGLEERKGDETKTCGVHETHEEYMESFSGDEIDHGSGFIIGDKHVITCKHVVQDAVDDEETIEIRVVNDVIGKLPCKVVHCDAANDLALLYCEDLDLKQTGICPLELYDEKLWPSVSLFTFGYPLTHTGKKALFVKGFVSGFVERYGREPLMVLNCPVNHGNSGGPVFCRIGKTIKVVGVVAQKHKKEILTLDEKNFIENERQVRSKSHSKNRELKFKSIMFKLYDACNETHCQFNYGNAVPGHLVSQFMADGNKMLESIDKE